MDAWRDSAKCKERWGRSDEAVALTEEQPSVLLKSVDERARRFECTRAYLFAQDLGCPVEGADENGAVLACGARADHDVCRRVSRMWEAEDMRCVPKNLRDSLP